MNNHVARFSDTAVMKSEDRNEIINHLFSVWISIFGTLWKVFSDNGGEFSNEDYYDMCDSYKIMIKRTAAEAPFSNGLMESQHAILVEILLKPCAGSGCSTIAF